MNIYLVPHTWVRHIAVSLSVAGAALVTWFFFLHVIVWLGPSLFKMGLYFSRGAEGMLFLSLVGGSIAATSVLAENSLKRNALWKRLLFALGAAILTFFLTMIAYWIMHGFVYLFSAKEMKEIVADRSLTSLQHHVYQWAAAGFCSGLGPLVVRVAASRRFEGAFQHLFGGLVAGWVGCTIWHYFGYHVMGDLYLGAAMGAMAWGLLHGLLVWAIPSDLYAGWIRVLSPYRYGYRIPVDHIDGTPSERFIGHFPRGLDVFLPVEQGIAELHTSYVVDAEQRYAVRGLSVWPTEVKRFLERIDLRYDPSRPAPLETELHMEDRITMSDGQTTTEVEFILLPKEER